MTILLRSRRPSSLPRDLQALVISRWDNLMTMDPRRSKQQMITCLRIDHVELMSGSDLAYHEIEVGEPDCRGFLVIFSLGMPTASNIARK